MGPETRPTSAAASPAPMCEGVQARAKEAVPRRSSSSQRTSSLKTEFERVVRERDDSIRAAARLCARLKDRLAIAIN